MYYTIRFFSILSIAFLSTFATAQKVSSSEKVARKFLSALSEGNYEKALSFTMGEAYDMFVEDYNRNSYERISGEINVVTCTSTATEYGAECECAVILYGRGSTLILSFASVDKQWFIYTLDVKRSSSRQEIEQNDLNAHVNFKLDPVQTLGYFATLTSEGNYKKALTYTTLSAKSDFENLVSQSPNLLPVQFVDINCTGTNKTSMIECDCYSINKNGDTIAQTYTLAPINKSWRIMEFRSAGSVYRLVSDFVSALANGDCEDAKRMSARTATDLVQGSIDAGCVSYRTEIISIECETFETTSKCTCMERRDGMDMTFVYDLEKISGKWFVVNYQKDLQLENDTEIVYDSNQESLNNVFIDKEKVCDNADSAAVFIGGDDAMHAFVKSELRYPDVARKTGIEGTVTINFIVEEDGRIGKTIIKKSVHPAMDDEAIRIVESMPDWIPAYKNETPVRTWYTLNIVFKI